MATDNITDKNTLKSWFKRGLKPLESQFHAWMDSFWHKSESIPTASIDGLESTLNNKAETTAMNNLSKGLTEHKDDSSLHKTVEEQGKLDNLADNPNMTYATKEELEELENNPDVIVIPIDFGKVLADRKAEMESYIMRFVEDESIYTKPIFANYTWKNTYDENASVITEYHRIVPNSAYIRGGSNGTYTIAQFNFPIEVLDIDESAKVLYHIYIDIRKTASGSRIFSMFAPYIADNATFFLQDNGDGIMTTADKDESIGTAYYALRRLDDFYQALNRGETPAIYLKTNNTENYIPASYKLVKDQAFWEEKKSSRYYGEIQISYLKKIDGENQLWTETRKFTTASRGFVGNNSRYEVPEEGIIQKISLSGSGNVYILDFNSNLEDCLNPEVLDRYMTDYSAHTNPLLLVRIGNLVVLPTGVISVTNTSTLVACFSAINITPHVPEGGNDQVNFNEYLLDARKQDAVWNCTLSLKNITLDDWNYLKASNIHIVSEYPTDLRTYPDGSIFIRQEVAS